MGQGQHAGDEAPDPEARPWEQPGAVRRDCEPHRGPLLVWLGLAGLFCAQLGFLAVPTLFALGLGLAVWLMAQSDLKKMRAGLMDPAGRGQAMNARFCGVSATLLGAFWAVGFACLLYALSGTD